MPRLGGFHMSHYRLIGRLPVPCSLEEWAVWFETADRFVAKTEIGPLRVSTVFLGLDHSFGYGDPVLFETIIFDDGDDHYQVRARTWDEAEKCHAEAVAIAKARLVAAEKALAGKTWSEQ